MATDYFALALGLATKRAIELRGCQYDLEVASIDPERCPGNNECQKCLMCKTHCKLGQQGGCGVAA